MNGLYATWKKTGIQKKLLFSVLVFLVLFSSLISFFFFRIYTESVQDEIETRMEELAAETSQLVGKILEVNKRPLLGFANRLETENLSVESYVDILRDHNLGLYETLAYVDPEGFAHYIDGIVLDLHDRTYVQKALNGEANYSDLVLSRITGAGVILGAVPVYDQYTNEIKGAVIARFNLSTINELFTSIRYAKDGYSYLIDSQDFFVIHQNEVYTRGILQGVNLFDLSLVETRITDFARFYRETKNANQGFGRYTLDNETMWAGFSSVEGTGWRFFVVDFERNLLANLRGTRQVLLAILIVIDSLAVLGMGYLSSSLSKPILELDQTFIRAIEGDLSVRMPVSNSDEVSRVSMNFNRMMDKIHSLMYMDPVTQLPNLGVLRAELFLENQTSQTSPIFILISIDNWSILHETYGHKHVDELHRKITSSIKEEFEDQTQMRLYKSRNDEYLICILNNTNREHVHHLARRILLRLRKPYRVLDKSFLPEVSIGIDFAEKDPSEKLFAHVTNAKNRARELGGNNISTYDEAHYLNVIESRGLVEDLFEAIETNAFSLVFQPVVDLATKETVLLEVLLRWKHPTKGDISPGIFIELSEKLKIVDKIDYWVIDNSFRLLKQSNSPLMVSVNIAAQTFERDDFVAYILGRIEFHGIQHEQVQLELTERDLIMNVDHAIAKLNRLRTLGISVAIDDFGMGYSSLSYIVKLPVDCIKIDRSFICSMINDASSRVLVEMIITMCKALGFKIVAEGIENEAEVLVLLKLDCHLGQGYYFSRPLSQIGSGM